MKNNDLDDIFTPFIDDIFTPIVEDTFERASTPSDENFYRIRPGDCFDMNVVGYNDFAVLSTVYTDHFALICLKDGNRWNDPLFCKKIDGRYISSTDFQRMLGSKGLNWKKLVKEGRIKVLEVRR